MADNEARLAKYDPYNDGEVVLRIERILPDLVWLAERSIQPSMSGPQFLFITAFGFGEHGNVHGCGQDVASAIKQLRGAVAAELLERAA